MGSPAAASDTVAREQGQARLRGIALMTAANFFFASIDATAKFLIHDMNSLQVTWARFAGAFAAALFLANIVFKPERMRTGRPWLQLIRSAMIAVANTMMVFAFHFLQLDQTVSIMFTVPFIVAGLAVPLLGERIGPRRWTAIAVGFFGVLLVMRPGMGGIHPAALLCLLSAVAYSFYSILTRILSQTDSSATTLFYTNVVGVLALSAVVPFVWTTPTPRDAALMTIMGALATFGHFLLIMAHRLAPASILSPFMYTQLIWMIFYGYVVFADLPSRWTLAGAGVVIGSGLYLLYRERKVKGPDAPVSGDPVG
jgi:drug/metabolite transporter (DMT)-like permease